jgi:hypothetical protein
MEFPISGAGVAPHSLDGYRVQAGNASGVLQLEIGMRLPRARGIYGFRGLLLSFSEGGRTYVREIPGAILLCAGFRICPTGPTARFTGLAPALITEGNKQQAALDASDSGEARSLRRRGGN